jgi:hypothetical protein
MKPQSTLTGFDAMAAFAATVTLRPKVPQHASYTDWLQSLKPHDYSKYFDGCAELGAKVKKETEND